MARCASMISPTETPARSSCTASASANKRALPWAIRAPPPEPTLISTTPCASKVRKASRATMRLTPKRPARSFSVPRKSPGRSSLANSASRTWATICVDMVAVRKGMTFRSPLFIAGCSRMQALQRSRLAHPGEKQSAKSSNDHKDDIFVPATGQPPCAPSHSLLEARGLGNPTPALALRLDVAGEFFGTAAERVDALPPPRQHDLVCRPPLAHGPRQLVDDIPRR